MLHTMQIAFKNKYLRCFLRAEDYLRVNNYAAYRSRLLILLALFTKNNRRKLASYVAYLTNHYNSPKRNQIIRQALATIPETRYDYPILSKHQTLLHHSIVLKKYVSKNERGILLVSFENELHKLILLKSFSAIEETYQLIFLPSWHPIYSVPLFHLGAKACKPFFIMPSLIDNTNLSREISSFCISLPFHAASWVNEKFYARENPRKDIDIIMVAIFGKYKRHWKLFEALVELPSDVTVCLLGKPYEGRNGRTLLKEAKAFGVEDRITIIEDPNQDTIANCLSRSKIFCALSHKEGSYIAVVESLMADTPVGMYANAMIGSKAYINDQTGVLFDPDRKLGPQLKAFLDRSRCFAPHIWAKEHISAHKNCTQLNDVLREVSISSGYVWSRDIEKFYCRHFDFYYDRGDEAEGSFSDAYRDLGKRFGLFIERPFNTSLSDNTSGNARFASESDLE